MAKDKDYIKLISSGKWAKIRRVKLNFNPICELCEKEGYITAATEVHHIQPVEEMLTYADKERMMFNPSNLCSLCHDCHVKIHTEMGRSGK
jgi:5-methylcytosine-specific restriction protein A